MKHITRKNHQAGFTLIELSIALVIISLLITSVVAASKARENSILNSIMQDMNKLSFAFNGFKEIYLSAPGDFATATSVFSSSAVTVANGDGNSYVNINSAEAVLALQHLSLSGMIAGSYCANWNISSTCLNYMPSRAAKGKDGYYFASASKVPGASFSVFDNNIADSAYDNMVVYAMISDADKNNSYDQPDEATYAILSPVDAAMLDNKYDDGKPKTGKLIAADGSNASNKCLSGDAYKTTTAIGCYLANIINN